MIKHELLHRQLSQRAEVYKLIKLEKFQNPQSTISQNDNLLNLGKIRGLYGKDGICLAKAMVRIQLITIC